MDIRKLYENAEDLLELLNCLNVGVYITDGEGNTLLVNDASCETGSLTRSDVIGKNMQELERIGFVKESVSLKVIRSQKEEHMLQSLGDGGKVYVTARPKFKGNRIEYIVCTERDITEMEMLRNVLKEKESVTEKYEEELEYLRNRNIAMMGDIISRNLQSRMAVERAVRAAALDTTILLLGESGTGKEVFANMIYKNSGRIGKPYIKVNCAAIPASLIESEMFGYEKGAFTGAGKDGKRGYFELANTGTIFLDEIGEIPIHLQSKLLRVLQEREIMRVGGSTVIPLDIRLISATKVNLAEAVRKGTFREDLYYRLNVMPIEIPPLRERREDIGALAEKFVEAMNKQYGMEKHLERSAIEALEAYKWPGNIRELQNVIERTMISFDGASISKFQIQQLLYPKDGSWHSMEEAHLSGLSLKELLTEYESNVLRSSIEKNGTASKAAKALSISKATMSRKMQKYLIK